MAEHENCIGETDEWYTPPEIFKMLGCEFDLDPCAPLDLSKSHVPFTFYRNKWNDGLKFDWHGFVWMNPPFGGRNGHIPWLKKFIEHGNGIGLCRSYTSSGWWHDWMPKMDTIFFPRGKTKFIREDGSIGKSPGHGVAIFAKGEKGGSVLNSISSEFGMVWNVKG